MMDLLRHSIAVVRDVPTGAPLDPDGEDRGRVTRAPETVGTYRGLIQPKSARERAAWTQTDAAMVTHRIYLEAAALGNVDTDCRLVKAGGNDPDLDGTYRVGFVGNAAGWGHHVEIDAERLDA